MPSTVAQKLLVEVSADAEPFDALAARGTRSFQTITVAAKRASSDVAAIGPTLGKTASSLEQFGQTSTAVFAQVGGSAGQAFARVQSLLTSPLGAAGAAGVSFAGLAIEATKMAAAIEGSFA